MTGSTRLDTWPGAAVLALGLALGAGLGGLALVHPAATALLVLALPLALRWQGRRVRVLWGEGVPLEVEVPPPPRPEPQAELEPPPPREPLRPHPLQDPLIELIALPGGSFRMGSDKELDPQTRDDELPQREVRVRAFAMARTPVTRGLYRSVMPAAPWDWGRDKGDDVLPANYVSWQDAVRFCNALSERTGLAPCYREVKGGWSCDWAADGYRLPTEAEWEYACRAGTDTPWFWGGDADAARYYAWFSGISGSEPHPVGGLEPNPWGFQDMTGNVWEWCWDWYTDTYDPADTDNPRGAAQGRRRVLRGGSFGNVPGLLRSAVRLRDEPGLRFVRIGFRCVRGSVRQPDH